MAVRSHHDINAIVKQVRRQSRGSIIKQCSTIQVLDMTQPIGLNDIYVSVNILETIVGRRQLEISDLLQGDEPERFNRWGLGRINEKRVPGLTAVEKYSKLIVLGKPGAGKTTFLKYLAIQCSLGKFQVDKVPIFITLKDLAEVKTLPNFLIYITQIMQDCGVNKSQLFEILTHGKTMLLLDGLDEVRQEDIQRVFNQIHEFAARFASTQFVISCRLAGQEYNFEDFAEVEIADFDFQQISTFATKWFAAIAPVKGDRFIQKLSENESIQELATNPLLLTLLCLMFQEIVDFPWNRLELYQEGLNLLLKKWDANKNVERYQIYKKLSIQQKQDLISQIAFITFERGEYFFTKQELQQYIFDYICNLPCASHEVEKLKSDSLTVLKSIEVQHGLIVERARGIYSFSHLIFQEYFTARQIAVCSHPQVLETALQKFVCRITEPRWREVFLITVGMLRNADYLLELIKQQVDQLVAQDRQLQTFLAWVNQKSRSVTAPYKQGALRAFYITLACTLFLLSETNLEQVSGVKLDIVLDLAGDTLELAFTLDDSFALNRSEGIDLIIDWTLVVALARAVNMTFDITLAAELISVLDLSITLALKPEIGQQAQRSLLGEALLALKQQLPNLQQKPAIFKQWWQANGMAWIEQLRAVMNNQRQIGYDWQLSEQQKETLRQYYNANQLLLDCLNNDCYVTRAVRSHIEATIMLPVAVASEL